MARTSTELQADAERIWWAGVQAVQPSHLIPATVALEGDELLIGDDPIDLRRIRRIPMVGGGKAAGAMAGALEAVLGERLLAEKHIEGWINVPAGCVVPTRFVHLHTARPAGVNEPRVEGVTGTQRILEVVSSLNTDDLCLCLISGGGSALLPAPADGITLEDKICVARVLSAAGADITQLNLVRSQLSRVKGGGLARACRAGQLVTLIISDVLGDPLDLIASGPTVPSDATARDALDALASLRVAEHPALQSVVRYLRSSAATKKPDVKPTARITNLVIANNATAVDAAGCEAERLGYSHAMISATRPEGPAEDVGRHLAEMAQRMRRERGPDCLISGGEPTVKLVDAEHRGRGGRNQQLALAALKELGDCEGIALLSGGTDGEDGPTDAAGAIVTPEVVQTARRLNLLPQKYLQRNDAYSFFAESGGLWKTGPTQTNVCDLRVVVTDQSHHH